MALVGEGQFLGFPASQPLQLGREQVNPTAQLFELSGVRDSRLRGRTGSVRPAIGFGGGFLGGGGSCRQEKQTEGNR